MVDFPLYQVDSFTNQPFKGNPAGVCLLPEFPAESWMMALAAEMNLSETAFVVQRGADFDLRWFTPSTEIDLCGHATLASAHILWQTGKVPAENKITFHTRSGLLSAVSQKDWIELNFPARACEPVEEWEGVTNALHSLAPTETWRTAENLLYVYAEESQIRGMQPDFTALAHCDLHGVIVTAPSKDPQFDFVSRFFAPRIGINEDPVTGSAHCSLAPYWQRRLRKDHMTGYQASARGGVVRVRVSAERVYLSGQAVTVFATSIQGS